MRLKKTLIIGVLTLGCWLGAEAQKAEASFCTEAKASTYKSIYCQMEQTQNGDADEAIIAILKKQFDLTEKQINQILEGRICQETNKLPLEERKQVPQGILRACSPQSEGATKKLFAQDLIFDVQNSYAKEKALYFNKEALKLKFKTSEKYWDGKIGGPGDAPFDLITDLNLIDKVLFGSKAKWQGDVFQFPDNTSPSPQEEGLKLEDLPQVPEKPQNLNSNPDCVPIGDPEAEPTPLSPPVLCGNGKTDLLSGESCDDGNQTSGDGCNQFCQGETHGSSEKCQDPEALTFKTPAQAVNTNTCPAGQVPRAKNKSMENQTNAANTALEPFIGGTLKSFDPSQRPVCPAGQSPLEVTIAGKKQILKDSNGDPRCVPNELCADPDLARSFLAATSFPGASGPILATTWKELPEDNPIRQSLEAIEASVCVNVIKENRPTSYYNPNEGCVECHLSAMVDSLEEALTTNVSPLANTTKAFGLSTRFGPNMSFNLSTLMKPKLNFSQNRGAGKVVEDTAKAIEEAEKEATKPDLTIPNPRSASTEASTQAQEDSNTQTALKESLQGYRQSSDALGEVKLVGKIDQLIQQMNDSFEFMQAQYQDMVNTTELNKTPICR